jgi:hypothetical protein
MGSAALTVGGRQRREAFEGFVHNPERELSRGRNFLFGFAITH